MILYFIIITDKEIIRVENFQLGQKLNTRCNVPMLYQLGYFGQLSDTLHSDNILALTSSCAILYLLKSQTHLKFQLSNLFFTLFEINVHASQTTLWIYQILWYLRLYEEYNISYISPIDKIFHCMILPYCFQMWLHCWII